MFFQSLESFQQVITYNVLEGSGKHERIQETPEWVQNAPERLSSSQRMQGYPRNTRKNMENSGRSQDNPEESGRFRKRIEHP
ncbi:hypothetical protein LIER_18936 [Lithospermum erythrorhizon]|uniref:Uncharacterized protein n=1 Tax=Lithospermum erythrorhizon TaxID=34254 RepID=A0AAV3QFW2_LITER